MPSLFKYCGPNLVEAVLVRHTLRFTPPSLLNDPFDCLPSITIDDAHIQRFCNANWGTRLYHWSHRLVRQQRWQTAPPNKDKLITTPDIDEVRRVLNVVAGEPSFWEEVLYGTFREMGLGVLSMSTDGLSPLMWAYYSAEHRGFVVEFDVEGLELTFKPVSYSDHRISQDAHTGYDPRVLLTKSTLWAYEQEHRAFTPINDARVIERQDLTLLQFPASAIKSVTIGHRLDAGSFWLLRDALSKHDSNHVALSEATLDPTSYALVRRKL